MKVQSWNKLNDSTGRGRNTYCESDTISFSPSDNGLYHHRILTKKTAQQKADSIKPEFRALKKTKWIPEYFILSSIYKSLITQRYTFIIYVLCTNPKAESSHRWSLQEVRAPLDYCLWQKAVHLNALNWVQSSLVNGINKNIQNCRQAWVRNFYSALKLAHSSTNLICDSFSSSRSQ